MPNVQSWHWIRLDQALMVVTSLDNKQVFSDELRLGYVPMSDCAPIAVAHEMGLFERYDLSVTLSREPGWNSIQDKIYLGQLDAAQSIAGIAFALSMGFPELRCEVAVPLILNLHGNAVTLSRRLDPELIGSGEGLKEFMATSRPVKPLKLAATHPFSSHHILLRQWLTQHGLEIGVDARIVYMPPHLMPVQLKSGEIDGYCVGEPWNSKAIVDGDGWCPTSSSHLSHGHPEKVLLLSGRFLRKERQKSIRLVAALLDACKLCQDPDFHESLVQILSREHYIGISPEALRNELSETLPRCSDFHIFHGKSVNRPTVEKAAWVLAELTSIAALPQMTAGSLSRIYREDLYHEALYLSRN